jgi:hypothetical protein
MRRKLYSSRQVKKSGTVYVPSENKQQPAEICLYNIPSLERIYTLIEKYKLQCVQ